MMPISVAAAASGALPGLFPPVAVNGRWYVDGALKKTLHATVLLDMGLPDMNGVELCLEITSLYPATRVCVVSGAIGPKDRDRAFQAGCAAYLLKPFGAKELKTLVAPLLAELAGNRH